MQKTKSEKNDYYCFEPNIEANFHIDNFNMLIYQVIWFLNFLSFCTKYSVIWFLFIWSSSLPLCPCLERSAKCITQSLDETKAASLFQVKFKVRRPNESQQWKVVEIISLEVGKTVFMLKLIHPPVYILSRQLPSGVRSKQAPNLCQSLSHLFLTKEVIIYNVKTS